MASALEQILGLKQRKEEKAQMAMRAARMALDQAARTVERRREEAETFDQTLLARQTSLYDGLEGRVCGRAEIDEVREEIAHLRERQAALHAEVAAAEEVRRKAAQALEEARRAHLQAVKKVEKFLRLVELERAADAALEQYVEDTAMDEFIRLGEPADP